MTEQLKDEGLEPSLSSDFNIDDMSDEDILNMPFPSLGEESESVEAAEADEDETEDDEDTYYEEEDTEEEQTLLDEEDEDEEVPSLLDSEEDEDLDTEIDEDDNDSDVDYKAKYDELLAPFRANGKEIKVDSADDLRRLAQMGVGYNAKMAELKPLRKIAKMLETADLLDEEKINYLIDLSKGNASAINKLVSDSGIHPLDIDTDSTEDYKPNTYNVNDNQLALDEALDELERTSSGQRVIELVSTKLDKASKQVLVSNPEHMHMLAQHIESGLYDQVMARVERERLFNRIPAGASDLDAYNMIGQQMAQAGELHTPAPTPKAAQQKQAKDAQRQQRKRAAASPRGKKKATPKPIQNVLDMPDDEFEKLLIPKYM